MRRAEAARAAPSPPAYVPSAADPDARPRSTGRPRSASRERGGKNRPVFSFGERAAVEARMAAAPQPGHFPAKPPPSGAPPEGVALDMSRRAHNTLPSQHLGSPKRHTLREAFEPGLAVAELRMGREREAAEAAAQGSVRLRPLPGVLLEYAGMAPAAPPAAVRWERPAKGDLPDRLAFAAEGCREALGRGGQYADPSSVAFREGRLHERFMDTAVPRDPGNLRFRRDTVGLALPRGGEGGAWSREWKWGKEKLGTMRTFGEAHGPDGWADTRRVPGQPFDPGAFLEKESAVKTDPAFLAYLDRVGTKIGANPRREPIKF